jgi:hypothetical protein
MGAKNDLETRDKLQNSIDCIRISINDSYQAGSDIAVVPLDAFDVEHIEAIKSALAVNGRTFDFDEATGKLKIDSTDCVSED